MDKLCNITEIEWAILYILKNNTLMLNFLFKINFKIFINYDINIMILFI